MKKFKCVLFPKKATFLTQQRASRALMRIISHTTVNMLDLHTYECPNKVNNMRHWHVGKRSRYEQKLAKESIQPTVLQTEN